MGLQKELQDIIRNNGSTIYKGVHYTSVGQVPSDAVLAHGDEEQEKQAIELLEQEISARQRELENLKASRSAAKASSSKEEPKAKAEEPKAKAEAPKEPAKSDDKSVAKK